jgi:putative phage-type endonuclease
MTTELRERNERAGATDVATMLGLSPHGKTAWELWAEKRGLIEPWAGNESTRMGNLLESAVLDAAESDLGPLERDVLCMAKEVDFPLSATLDSRVIATGEPCDAKTSGIVGPVYGAWGEEGTDSIPAHYIVQLMVQLVCSDSELAHLYALLGGRGIVRYRVPRDEECARAIVDSAGRWWQRHIVQGIEPDRGNAVPLEVVKRLKRVPQKVITFGDDGMAAVSTWELAKARKAAAERECEEAQAELLLMLGEAEHAELPDGRTLSYYEQARRGYVVADGKYRVLRLRKAIS